MTLKRWLLACIALIICPLAAAAPGQKVPSKERVLQIQQALIDHGYMSGKPADWTWEKTLKVCRDIAEVHKWQTIYAPDARVLGMIGLGSSNFNPAVTDPNLPENRLDQLERHEGKEE